MDAIVPLVDFILGKKYEDLPAESVDITKKCLLDSLGAMVAGSTAMGGTEVVDMVTEWGGRPEATISVYGQRVPCHNALWANAVMTRARELDSADAICGEHWNVATNPTALAVAELIGGVSGKEAITAITLAADMSLRLRSACKRRGTGSPWTTGSWSVFPAAAVAGRLMGLDKSRMLDAMGLAFAKMSNTSQNQMEGSLAVCVHHGLGVSLGLLAVLMAKKGIDGPHEVLEGEFGVYPALEQGQYDRNYLLGGLGHEYLTTHLLFKIYPSCALTHPAIEGALQLVEKHDIRPDDVKEIVVRVHKRAYVQCYLPEEEKRKPHNRAAAQFSIPYTVATAVVHRKVNMTHFTDESLRDPRVLKVASKVKCVVDPELASKPIPGIPPVVLHNMAMKPNIVEIKTSNGKLYSARIEYVKGDFRGEPVTWEELIDKFKGLLALAAKPLSPHAAEEIIDMVTHLEEVDDVIKLVPLLVAE